MQHGVAVVVVVVGADVEVPTEKIFLKNLFDFSSVFCFLRYNIYLFTGKDGSILFCIILLTQLAKD